MCPRLYMFEPFGAVRLNNNHWNATMSHSKVSFKAHYRPPSRTNPHIFSRQNEVVKLPHSYSSFWTNITLAGSFEGVFTSLLCGHLFFGGQVVYFEAPWKDVTKWVLLVQVYSWAWLGSLGAWADFKVPFGHVEARRWSHLPVLATLPAPTPQSKLDRKSICQAGNVSVDSWHPFHIYTWKISEIV